MSVLRTWGLCSAAPSSAPYAVLQRSLKNGNLCVYAEKQSPKFERAAMKWLRRYLAEKEPTLREFAKVEKRQRG